MDDARERAEREAREFVVSYAGCILDKPTCLIMLDGLKEVLVRYDDRAHNEAIEAAAKWHEARADEIDSACKVPLPNGIRTKYQIKAGWHRECAVQLRSALYGGPRHDRAAG